MFDPCVFVCLCVCRTRRQRAGGVRPGCDGRVEVGGDGAEPCTADTGQSQQGGAHFGPASFVIPAFLLSFFLHYFCFTYFFPFSIT